MAPTVWTIVVAGGSGARFGAPKQFQPLGDGCVVDRSVEVAAIHSDGVVLVVPPGHAENHGADRVVAGGTSRSESVRAGLSALPADVDIVVVHDGARPLASSDLHARVVHAVVESGSAVVPVVALADSIRRVVGTSADRNEFVCVQTPQGFPTGMLIAAHSGGGEASDDATLVESLGEPVVMVEGEDLNQKITTAKDLVVAQWALDSQDDAPRRAGRMELRVGNGFDIHRFSDDADRRLVLGGVWCEGSPGLVGHSDADVIAHVCAEALLGAAGLGDLGSHFPDTDPEWAGADSMTLLAAVVAEVAAQGWHIHNIDCSIVAEKPKLAPIRETIESNLSGVVGAPVTVKGRRAEKLGSIGRSEGIAGYANALLTREV